MSSGLKFKKEAAFWVCEDIWSEKPKIAGKNIKLCSI